MKNTFKAAWTFLNIIRHSRKLHRKLEIGPGPHPLEGFETLDVIWSKGTDYIWDTTKRLPFKNNTFDIIYTSHILEHVSWYQTIAVLLDWVRILKPGGALEVWVPDGLKICKALVDFELEGENYIDNDGWYRFNEEKDPCVWASGRIYTYGDGTGKIDHPNWHRALFTPRYLQLALLKAGLQNIERLHPEDVRGYDHGWINLGMRGFKNEL